MQIRNFALMHVHFYDVFVCTMWRLVDIFNGTQALLILTDMFFILVEAHAEFDSRPFRCKNSVKSKTLNYHSNKQKQTSQVILNNRGKSILARQLIE